MLSNTGSAKERWTNKIRGGETVKLHYTAKLDDGTVFYTSIGRIPEQLTIGSSQICPGFEQAVIGMSTGESKTIRMPPEKAYGHYFNEKMLVLNKTEFPRGSALQKGQWVRIRKDGQITTARIVNVSDTSVILDGNHPCAGKYIRPLL